MITTDYIFGRKGADLFGQIIISEGRLYGTAIELLFTRPQSTNDIAYYNIYVNGVLNGDFEDLNLETGLSVFAVDLEPITAYEINIRAVDIFGNISDASNTIVSTTITPAGIPTTGLKSYWKLDETTGNTIIDSFGNNNGTHPDLTGMSVAGVKNTALDFQGNKYATVPTNEDFELKDTNGNNYALSVSLWVYFEVIGMNNWLIHKRLGLNHEKTWELLIYNGLLRLSYTNQGDVTTNIIPKAGFLTPPAGEWVHITGILDPSDPYRGEIFYNGKAVGRKTAGLTPIDFKRTPGIDLQIGGHTYGTGHGKFRLDEVRIWKGKVLNAGEISDIIYVDTH